MTEQAKVMFQKAERRKVFLKLLLTGPSGAGKTEVALAMARQIGSRIAVIDTENGSASLYADRYQFDTVEIDAPYTTEKYEAAIRAAIAAKYDVVVVDSLSHGWAGTGGILQQKDDIDRRGGNQWTNWKEPTKKQESLIATILQTDVHMICTARSKMAYVQGQGSNGKQEVKKLGLQPIQRDGLEFEFTLTIDLAMDHSGMASKDRTHLFDGRLISPEEMLGSVGRLLMEWRNTAPAAASTPRSVVPEQAPLPMAAPTEASLNGNGQDQPLTAPPAPEFTWRPASTEEDKKFRFMPKANLPPYVRKVPTGEGKDKKGYEIMRVEMRSDAPADPSTARNTQNELLNLLAGDLALTPRQIRLVLQNRIRFDADPLNLQSEESGQLLTILREEISDPNGKAQLMDWIAEISDPQPAPPTEVAPGVPI